MLAPFRDQLPKRLFTEAFEFPRSTGSGRNRASLERARALLAQAGWHIADGVLVNSAGEPFEIEFLSRDVADQRTLLPYLSTLQRLGIGGQDTAGGTRAVRQSKPEIRLRRENHPERHRLSADRMVCPNFFHSQSASQPLSHNMAGIADPVVDALIAEAIKATTLEEMAIACRALDRVLLWGFYQIPLDAIAPFRIVYWKQIRSTGTGRSCSL